MALKQESQPQSNCTLSKGVVYDLTVAVLTNLVMLLMVCVLPACECRGRECFFAMGDS